MHQGRHAGVARLVLPHSVLGQSPHVPVLRISEAVDESGEIVLEISFLSSFLLDLPGKTSEAKLHPAQLLAQSEGRRLALHQSLGHVGVDLETDWK